MAKTFDAGPLLETLPSFYQTYLDGTDTVFLSKVWESLTRIIDAEYARAIQIARSNKVANATTTTLYPWVREEFDWQSQQVQHQHLVVEAATTDDLSFYLGRYVDLNDIELYYDGGRIELASDDIVTNELDSDQRAGSKPLGTRVVFGTAITPTSQPLTVRADRELFHATGATDGVATVLNPQWFDGTALSDNDVDDDFWQVTLTHQDISSEVSLAGDGTMSITVTRTAGFMVGQIVELFLVSGLRSQQVITTASTTAIFTFLANQTVDTTNLVINVQAYPNTTVVAADRVDFGFVLPVGATVRVTDPSGTQSFSITEPVSSLSFGSEVVPADTSVFLFGFDLTAVVALPGSFSFGRAPTANLLYKASAPFTFSHDHARYTETLVGNSSTITLPTTRPMALTPGFAMIPRYPVMVYLDGQLLEQADYSFTSTIVITKASGQFLLGQVVDVRYADAEAPAAHKHIKSEVVVPDGQELAVLDLGDTIDATKYPVFIGYTGIGALDPGGVAINANKVAVVSPAISVSGTITVRSDSAVFKHNYTHTMASRSDVSESYLGTLDSAACLQDGINAPATVLTDGTTLLITRDGDTTTIEGGSDMPVGWFKNARVDEHLVAEVLGEAVGLRDEGETTPAYVDAIRAVYAAYYQGSQVDTIENLACVILGSSFLTDAGTNRGNGVEADGTRTLNVTLDNGNAAVLQLRDDIPDRPVTARLDRFYAASAHCTVADKDFSSLPYLAFMAEATSDTYRYSKRLDVSEDRDFTSTPTSFSADTKLLIDTSENFFEQEVRKGDLIRLSTSAETDTVLSIAAEVIYLHVQEVIDEHTLIVDAELDTTGYGYGEQYGWGEVIGYGGAALAASIVTYTIWTRRTRTIDSALHLDEMLDDAQALASGESVQRVNAVLAELLNRFLFSIRIDWYAQTDQERLGYLKHFLTTAKAAETGFFAYTKVENDAGVTDTVSATISDDDDVTMTFPLRETYIGQDFMDSFFVPA